MVSGEVLILAGDIAPLQDINHNNAFLQFASQNYEKVFWVPGNHEYYHNDIANYPSSFNFPIGRNIHVVNNISLDYKGIRFIFTTLWSNISKPNQSTIEQGVADFTFIAKNSKKIRATDYNQLHEESLQFLNQRLSATYEKTVVVTHHLPSHYCNSPQHQDSKINEAFCVDITEIIRSCKVNFWIYGHSHFNQKPLFIGDTILLTNQLGMVQLNEHGSFKPKAYFSI